MNSGEHHSEAFSALPIKLSDTQMRITNRYTTQRM